MTATTTAKKVAKKVAKEDRKPRAKKLLRNAQMRALDALSKAKRLNKEQIEAKAAINPVWTYDMLGRLDAADRKRIEEAHGFSTLVTLGLVKVSSVDVDGKAEAIWEITPKGREALKQAKADAKAKE